MKRLAIVAAIVFSVVVAPLLLVGVVMMQEASATAPSDAALEDIPAEMLALYQAAAPTCPGLEWTVVAAIGKLETDHNRARDQVSSAGALGPMQFLPSTFAAYGVDGDGDGKVSITDVEDAVYSAVNYLCANGAGDPARLRDAIFRYNHSLEYVEQVLELAAEYGVITFAAGSSDPRELLDNPRIILTSQARYDLQTDQVDPRVVAMLDALAQRHSLGISVFRTGHSKFVAGTDRVSNHYYGRAVDIWMIDGAPVSPSNAAARQVVLALAGLPAGSRPTEIGHPFSSVSIPGGFTDAAHYDHVHAGFHD